MIRRALSAWNVLALCVVTTAVGGQIPNPPDTERSTTGPQAAPEAAAAFRVPEGFHVGVFAAEPDVRNPVAMAWDPRGRLWVAENYTYSDSSDRFDLRLRDRVLIFEERDGDGRFDRRKVFTDDVQRLGSVELGLGGVWLLCPPQLLFVPDRDGDDTPDGPAEVVLDGFKVATENYHTFANGLRWGPDGWLYGRCGASSPAQVGAPGTPEARRVPVRGGSWRYHPGLKRFEALVHGTTNPWGHDWNALGELFFINTANGHLWHMIPGAHFARPHTIEPNPRAYAIIDQHADHYHWDNSREMTYPFIPTGEDARRGGGHAHSGLLIYQANQWPGSYRDKLLTLNFHGRRVNVERLERSGSGYVGRHEPDAFFASDPWFRGIDLGTGPDGSVFVLDWSDTGECHDHDGVHRSSGRIYRITFGKAAPAGPVDVSKLGPRELVAMHRSRNEWFVRQARRMLVERRARGEPMDEARHLLRAMFHAEPDPVIKIRTLCTDFSLAGEDRPWLLQLLHHDHESVRAWSIRFLTDRWPIDTVDSTRIEPEEAVAVELEGELTNLARSDPSGLVRLVLASTLQRLPVDRRAGLARALVGRDEDASDHNIPAMVWTGLIPVAQEHPDALVALAEGCKLPLVLRLMARRLSEDLETRPAPLGRLLEVAADSDQDFQVQVASGMSDALEGWRKARKPAGWDRLSRVLGQSLDTAVRTRARDLDVLFGDGRALDEVRRLALDDHAPLDARKSALKTLIESRPPDLRAICQRLLRVRFLNPVAARGLALFDDPSIGRVLAESYRAFHPSERAAVIDTLASRPSFASALLDQIAAGKIPRADLTAFHARQIRSLGNPPLAEKLAQVWGESRDSASDRRPRIAALKSQLRPDVLARADASRGRVVFERVCASCHKLYGYGGEIGPDLTGAGRDNLDYLLENLVDPSASVSADFRMSVVAMSDGRVLNGLVRARTDRTLTLQTQTEALALDRNDIEDVRSSPFSLMPDGLLDPLSPEEVRDLVGYLMTRTQVPLPRPDR